MENKYGLLKKIPFIEKKSGWPWTEEVNPIIYDKYKVWPKITIVTPSFNQGNYIEETIRSILLQNYPNLEYIIMDGGSHDETVNVIKKYEKYIQKWVSEADNGQSDAINKGFNQASGEMLAWINSDDVYFPKALFLAAQTLREKELGLLFGNASYYFEDRNEFCLIDVVKKRSNFRLPFDFGLIQPSTFWTKKLWDKVGVLDINLHYGFDWDWYLRASKIIDFTPLNFEIAIYRIHESHKSGNGGAKRSNELLEILDKHNYQEYAQIIKKLGIHKYKVKSIVRLTSNYRLGNLIYGGIKLVQKDFRNFTILEISEIFNKAAGIYNY